MVRTDGEGFKSQNSSRWGGVSVRRIQVDEGGGGFMLRNSGLGGLGQLGSSLGKVEGNR